jgi:diguanylate cyclase (GGDEF)-like protein/PAS domain S-box-containing protein
MFGYSPEEAAGQLATMVPPKRAGESTGLFDRAMKGETIRDLHIKRRRKDGTLVDVRAAAAPMYGPDGAVRGVTRAYEDITDKVRAEAQLNRVAHYDQLTGLPNRLTLQKELGRLLAGADARPTTIALFDLDGFKDVNDTYDHAIGDRVLASVADRLRRAFRSDDVVARYGGDEFVVVCTVDDTSSGRAITVGVERALADPIVWDGGTWNGKASIGIARVEPNDEVTDVLRRADRNMYLVKAQRRLTQVAI